MNIYLKTSLEVAKKLKTKFEAEGIMITDMDEADYALVEAGHPFVDGLVNIAFEALDYIDAYELVTAAFQRNKMQGDDLGNGPDTITGFSNDRYGIIPIKEIHYIEAFGSDVRCQCRQGDFQLKKPLYHYEHTLSSKGLFRINKSQIINLAQVREIIPWFNGRLVLKLSDDLQLEVSKTYAKKLRALLDL